VLFYGSVLFGFIGRGTCSGGVSFIIGVHLEQAVFLVDRDCLIFLFRFLTMGCLLLVASGRGLF